MRITINNQLKNILTVTLLVFLFGCSKTENTESIDKVGGKVDTTDLIADKNFDFKTNHEVKLIVSNADTGKGVLSIYKSREVSVPGDQVFADPLSRITSVISIAQTSVNILVNDSWNEIIIVWVPESAGSLELVKAVKLSPEISVYTIDL